MQLDGWFDRFVVYWFIWQVLKHFIDKKVKYKTRAWWIGSGGKMFELKSRHSLIIHRSVLGFERQILQWKKDDLPVYLLGGSNSMTLYKVGIYESANSWNCVIKRIFKIIPKWPKQTQQILQFSFCKPCLNKTIVIVFADWIRTKTFVQLFSSNNRICPASNRLLSCRTKPNKSSCPEFNMTRKKRNQINFSHLFV